MGALWREARHQTASCSGCSDWRNRCCKRHQRVQNENSWVEFRLVTSAATSGCGERIPNPNAVVSRPKSTGREAGRGVFPAGGGGAGGVTHEGGRGKGAPF